MHDTFQTACPHCHTPSRFDAAMPAEALKCGACGKRLFTGKAIELTGETFAAHLAANEIPLVVDFWADWCAPCHAIASAIRKAVKDLEPHVRFAKVDTDEEQKLAGQNAVRGLPTLIIYESGREVARHAGAMSTEQLKTWIQQHA